MKTEEISVEQLEHQILDFASHLNAATARWLELIGEYDSRGAYESWEVRSMAHWLNWHCGVSLGSAREQVRVARSLRTLPIVSAAFASGRLSYSKARAITRVAEPSTEADLVSIALSAPASVLERLTRGYRKALGNQELEDSNHRHGRRLVSWHWDDDGSFVMFARLDPESGAVLLNALEQAKEAVPGPGEAQRCAADSLVAMAERSLSASEFANVSSEVLIHVDAHLLSKGGSSKPGTSRIEGGPSISPETARRLVCDGPFAALFEGGEETTIGRRSRKVPRNIRRALRKRDGGCRFPGCGSRYTDAHHIVHWADGGHTSLDNLIELCRHHHRAIHEGGYRVVLTPGAPTTPSTLVIHRPDGSVVGELGLNASSPQQLFDAVEQHNGAIPANACQPSWSGDRLDYNLSTELLFVARNRAEAGAKGSESVSAETS